MLRGPPPVLGDSFSVASLVVARVRWESLLRDRPVVGGVVSRELAAAVRGLSGVRRLWRLVVWRCGIASSQPVAPSLFLVSWGLRLYFVAVGTMVSSCGLTDNYGELSVWNYGELRWSCSDWRCTAAASLLSRYLVRVAGNVGGVPSTCALVSGLWVGDRVY